MPRHCTASSTHPDLFVDTGQGFDPADILPVDHWVARSLLQKAIRRGEADIAERAALTLLHLSGAAVWRRFLIIAFEDIGAGSAERVVRTVELCTDLDQRKALGGDAEAAAWLARWLASSPKDRSADHLICGSKDHPSLENARREIGGSANSRRLAMVLDQNLPIEVRATAAWYASSLEVGGERRFGRGDLSGLLRTYVQLGAPETLVVATRIAAQHTKDPIAIMVPLIWSEAFGGEHPATIDLPVPASPIINGVPLYSLDKHTALGKKAITRFARENEVVRTALEEHVAEYRHRDAACMAAFYADAVPLARKLNWTGSDRVERLGLESDMLRAGVPLPGIDPVLDAVRGNLDHLNELRAELARKSQNTEAGR